MLGENGKPFFYDPFEFISEVEAFEISKGTWKTINYISEPERLKIISPGAIQTTSSQIMLFGGLTPVDDAYEKVYNVTDQN